MDKIILKLRFFLRYSFLSLIGKFSIPSKGIHLLNGHFIDLSLYPSKNDFVNFLKKLNKHYTFVSFDEACKLIKDNSMIDSPLLAFSFDDGFKECSDIIADCLDEYNIKAAFFINPYSIDATKEEKVNFIKSNLKVDFYKEFMNWDDIINLHKKGHIIGNHTYRHTALKNLTYEDSYNEILNGKKIIEIKLNSKCDYFAFPFGGADFFDKNGLDAALNLHKSIFTSGGYESYFYNSNINTLSRRHFEANWPVSHINYFLSSKRKYNI